jgi:hypothetical protein
MARAYFAPVALHLIKLVVGADSIEALQAWRRAQPPGPWKVRTRQTPKRVDDLLDGGSIYRVFKGAILCRQEILAIDTLGEGRESRCEITVSEDVVRVAPVGRRPFQGWRYLPVHEAPADLAQGDAAAAMPLELARQLRELGAW